MTEADNIATQLLAGLCETNAAALQAQMLEHPSCKMTKVQLGETVQ